MAACSVSKIKELPDNLELYFISTLFDFTLQQKNPKHNVTEVLALHYKSMYQKGLVLFRLSKYKARV